MGKKSGSIPSGRATGPVYPLDLHRRRLQCGKPPPPTDTSATDERNKTERNNAGINTGTVGERLGANAR